MSEFQGTAAWLRGQWSNPNDIFTILLIIGGDVVRVAIAQLCAGPVRGLTPVSFSFGWVTYAVSAALSAVGENRLMPKPDYPCLVINAKSGYARDNKSWVLSRILRDFEYWMGPKLQTLKTDKLKAMRCEARERIDELTNRLEAAKRMNDQDEVKALVKALEKQHTPEQARIALRISVWNTTGSSARPKHDLIYWMGIAVAVVQLGIAAIPWGLYTEWLTFLVTLSGTLLALASGALPQWKEEKFGVRTIENLGNVKDVFLTIGNGAQDAILIRGSLGDVDLETLASPDRELQDQTTTKALSVLFAILWVALLVSVAGYTEHTWYLLSVGTIGILHNILVAGCSRMPDALGIGLKHEKTFMAGKVMAVLWSVEEEYPQAGASLVATFFPGRLWARERLLWKYAEKTGKARRKSLAATPSRLWKLPPLQRPEDGHEDDDIPSDASEITSLEPGQTQGQRRSEGPDTGTGAQQVIMDHIINIHD